jgi:hypothetical protein
MSLAFSAVLASARAVFKSGAVTRTIENWAAGFIRLQNQLTAKARRRNVKLNPCVHCSSIHRHPSALRASEMGDAVRSPRLAAARFFRQAFP